MQAVIDFLKGIYDWVIGLLPWLITLIKAIFQAIWVALQDLFLWVFETCLGLIKSIVSALPIDPQIFNVQEWLNSASPQLLEVFYAIHTPEAIGMIVTCLGIRLLMQLIPFTRLGS